MQEYKATSDGEMVKAGDIVRIDWNHNDTESCENITQGFLFAPIGSDLKVLETLEPELV